MGYAEAKLVASYKAAYDKRLKRLGFTEADLGSSFDLPVAKVNAAELPLETDSRNLSFNVSATDNSAELPKLQVYVNDVPAFGSKGVAISGNEVSQELSIQLSAGLKRNQSDCDQCKRAGVPT